MSLTTFSICSQTGSFPRLQTLYFCPLVLGDLRASNTITQGYKYTKESAANTISAIRQWLFFANYFHLPVLPVSADSVVLFLEFMARSSGYGHLKHLVSSLRFLHQALDISFPEVSFQLDMTMQGLKRRLARVPFQVLPITPDILRNMFCLLDMRKMSDLALWCAYLISFYSLLRKSNAVPKSAQFNPSQVLIRKNLSVDLPTNMVYLYLGFSKTNQFGAKDLVVPIPGNDDFLLSLLTPSTLTVVSFWALGLFPVINLVNKQSKVNNSIITFGCFSPSLLALPCYLAVSPWGLCYKQSRVN